MVPPRRLAIGKVLFAPLVLAYRLGLVSGTTVRAALVSMGEKSIDRANWNWNFVGDADNPFFTPDPESVKIFADYLDGIRKAGSSVGAVVEVTAVCFLLTAAVLDERDRLAGAPATGPQRRPSARDPQAGGVLARSSARA